jgi:transposase
MSTSVTGKIPLYKPFQNSPSAQYTRGMSRHDISDEQWTGIEPWIPKQRAGPGRQRNNDRQTLNGIFFVLKTGCIWEDVPRVYGLPATCWRRFSAWSKDGTWERIWRALLSRLDAQGRLEWAQAFLHGSFVPANKGDLGSATRRSAKAAT